MALLYPVTVQVFLLEFVPISYVKTRFDFSLSVAVQQTALPLRVLCLRGYSLAFHALTL